MIHVALQQFRFRPQQSENLLFRLDHGFAFSIAIIIFFVSIDMLLRLCIPTEKIYQLGNPQFLAVWKRVELMELVIDDEFKFLLN